MKSVSALMLLQRTHCPKRGTFKTVTSRPFVPTKLSVFVLWQRFEHYAEIIYMLFVKLFDRDGRQKHWMSWGWDVMNCCTQYEHCNKVTWPLFSKHLKSLGFLKCVSTTVVFSLRIFLKGNTS